MFRAKCARSDLAILIPTGPWESLPRKDQSGSPENVLNSDKWRLLF
jgi:hypothetical protein